MAKGEGSQRSSDAPIRVYKSKDLRKRPVKRKRAKSQDSVPAKAGGEAAAPSAKSADAQPGTPFDSGIQETSTPFQPAAGQADGAVAAAGRTALAGAAGTQPVAVAGTAADAGRQADADRQGGPVPGRQGGSGPADAGLQDELQSADGARQDGPGFSDGPWPAEADGAMPSEGPDAPRKEKPRRRIKPKGVLITLGLIVALVAVGFGAFFAWDRWGRYDDHADMQGQWYALGSTTPLTIDGQVIHLTDEIAYEYTIDDHAKTIKYTFGPMQGQGRYWFSEDRSFLAITDGEGFTGAGTALQDIVHLVDDLASSGVITGTKLPKGDGVIVLCRQPGLLATMAKEAGERAKARVEQQKAQEKAAAEKEAAEKRAAEEAREEREQAAQDAQNAGQYEEYSDSEEDADTNNAVDDEAAEGSEGAEEAEDGEGEAAADEGGQASESASERESNE